MDMEKILGERWEKTDPKYVVPLEAVETVEDYMGHSHTERAQEACIAAHKGRVLTEPMAARWMRDYVEAASATQTAAQTLARFA